MSPENPTSSESFIEYVGVNRNFYLFKFGLGKKTFTMDKLDSNQNF